VEGAEPGDTLAVHFISIEPRFDWGVSTSVEYFGSLTSTPTTAMLAPPLPEDTWFYQFDLDNRQVIYRANQSDLSLPLPLDPMHGTVGVAPGRGEGGCAGARGNVGGHEGWPG